MPDTTNRRYAYGVCRTCHEPYLLDGNDHGGQCPECQNSGRITTLKPVIGVREDKPCR